MFYPKCNRYTNVYTKNYLETYTICKSNKLYPKSNRYTSVYTENYLETYTHL